MNEIKRTFSFPEIEIAGVGDKLQYLVHEMNDNTIRFALLYPQRLSGEAMERAAQAVVEGADVLHSTFVPGNLEAYWQANLNLSPDAYFTLMETDADPMALVDGEMVKPILPQGKAQLHCTLIQGPGGSALVVRISHLCVDGGDGRYLLEKLVEAYNQILRTNSASGFQVKNGSRSVFQVYRELSGKEYISAMMPAMSSVKTEFPFPDETPGAPCLVKCRIPASTIRSIKAYGKSRGATINDMLLTAFYRAFASLPNVDPRGPLNIMSMMDLRRHCVNGESDGLCNMSGGLPTVLPHGVRGSFEDTLKEVTEQTAREKEKATAGMAGMPLLHSTGKILPLWLLLKAAHKVYGTMSLGLTNLGSLSGDALTMDGIRPAWCAFGGPLKKKPGMQISAVGLDGAVSLCCIGEYGEGDTALLRDILGKLEAELEALPAE